MISVKDFGAIANGVEDDKMPIQKHLTNVGIFIFQNVFIELPKRF